MFLAVAQLGYIGYLDERYVDSCAHKPLLDARQSLQGSNVSRLLTVPYDNH